MKVTLNKLSGVEQQVYFLFEERDQRVITPKEVANLIGISDHYARVILHRLTKKNACERIKAGLYVRFPASIVIDKGVYQEDPILLIPAITRKYFLSYYTALTFHGLAQRTVRIYYVSNIEHSGKIDYQGNRIQMVRLIPERFFGFISEEYSGKKVFVSDLERTILDVINRPEYAGGWREVILCLRGLRNVNWEKAFSYLMKFQTKSLLQKTGYILESLSSQINVPKIFLANLRKRISPNIYYCQKGKGKFSRKWNIIIDPNLFRE